MPATYHCSCSCCYYLRKLNITQPFFFKEDFNHELCIVKIIIKTLKQENKNLELENEKLEQDIKQRKKFFICSSVILFSWIIFIIILTIAQFMIKIFFEKEGLSDIQFSAVVATATATMIGGWHILGKSIFPKK